MDLRDTFASIGPVFENTFMLQLAEIQRQNKTRESTGAVIKTWQTVGITACDVYTTDTSQQNAERLLGSEEARVLSYRVSMPLGTDVTADDRLLLDDGRKFSIVAIPRTTLESTLEAVCVEVS